MHKQKINACDNFFVCESRLGLSQTKPKKILVPRWKPQRKFKHRNENTHFWWKQHPSGQMKSKQKISQKTKLKMTPGNRNLRDLLESMNEWMNFILCSGSFMGYIPSLFNSWQLWGCNMCVKQLIFYIVLHYILYIFCIVLKWLIFWNVIQRKNVNPFYLPPPLPLIGWSGTGPAGKR